VTIGLFEASETTMPTMVPKLWALFNKFSFTKNKNKNKIKNLQTKRNIFFWVDRMIQKY
jgi:hypothetical protein